MTAYYNEIDPKAAAWLRELIKNNLIADGEVDERDIQDVRPTDLHGFAQCHFFAGIGVWSYALRRAGWPDDRPVWTGSCPCQPFSSAGKGSGFDDERHLWPSWHWLIAQCRPAVVFGEQVASKDAEPWLDLVQADMEALAYAVGAVPFPSAGVGAPHIRDRLYWVADSSEQGRGSWGRLSHASDGSRPPRVEPGRLRNVGRLVNGEHPRLEGLARDGGRGGEPRWVFALENGPVAAAGTVGGLADPQHDDRWSDVTERRQEGRAVNGRSREPGRVADGSSIGRGAGRNRHHGGDVGPQLDTDGSNEWSGPTNGLWRAADWLFCRDGKWRPVEPGTFPLAHGAPARVGRLRGYGNAINAEAAVAWIEACVESGVGQ